MNVIAVMMLVIMAVTGAVHAAWALKIWWPIADEAQLARTVVGAKGITRMPSTLITWTVVGAIVVGMVWTMVLVGWLVLPLPAWIITAGGAVMGGIFLLRGVGSYFGGLFGIQVEEPFSTLNAWYFSPLITMLGIGTFVLVFA